MFAAISGVSHRGLWSFNLRPTQRRKLQDLLKEDIEARLGRGSPLSRHDRLDAIIDEFDAIEPSWGCCAHYRYSPKKWRKICRLRLSPWSRPPQAWISRDPNLRSLAPEPQSIIPECPRPRSQPHLTTPTTASTATLRLSFIDSHYLAHGHIIVRESGSSTTHHSLLSHRPVV